MSNPSPNPNLVTNTDQPQEAAASPESKFAQMKAAQNGGIQMDPPKKKKKS